jgi:hypothetical protein
MVGSADSFFLQRAAKSLRCLRFPLVLELALVQICLLVPLGLRVRTLCEQVRRTLGSDLPFLASKR